MKFPKYIRFNGVTRMSNEDICGIVEEGFNRVKITWSDGRTETKGDFELILSNDNVIEITEAEYFAEIVFNS